MNDRNLDELIREVDEHVGQGPSELDLARQKRQILNAMKEQPAQPSPDWVKLAGVAAALLCLLGAATFALWPSQRVPRAVEPPLSKAAPQLVELAGEGVFTWADGSRVSMAKASRAQLTSELGGLMVIELLEGELEADIVSAKQRQWQIRAGAYTATVVGTKFTVAWSKTKEYEVTVQEGKVRVQRQKEADASVLVTRDHKIRVTPENDTQSLGSLITSIDEAPKEPTEEAQATTPAIKPKPKKPAPPKWHELARRGEYEQAWSQLGGAKKRARLLGRLSAGRLLALADVARFNGDRGFARETLRTLRQRFASSPQSTKAAFRLGLLEPNKAKANAWFSRYVKESPKGELAADARGRILEYLVRTKDQARAQSAARDYLNHHPRGVHASQARKILGTSPP